MVNFQYGQRHNWPLLSLVLDKNREKGKTRYWLYMQLGLSYQNFKKIVENETTAIKFENLKAICDILECTPNDLFVEYHNK